MKRGSVKKSGSTFLGILIPKGMLEAMDSLISVEDSDRSKFTRRAIRNRLKELGHLDEYPSSNENSPKP